MLIYKNNPTLPQGGPDIGLKVGILAEIGNMLHECAVMLYIKFVHRKNDYEYEVLKSLMVIASAANHRSDC